MLANLSTDNLQLLCTVLAVFSEYYFSAENLKCDTFLRHSMDVHGWVPVEVVCGFRRVRQLSIDEEAVIQVLATICYCIFQPTELCCDEKTEPHLFAC